MKNEPKSIKLKGRKLLEHLRKKGYVLKRVFNIVPPESQPAFGGWHWEAVKT